MTAQSEKLVSDVKVLLSDTEELVRATAAQAGEKIIEIRNRAQSAANNLKPQLTRLEETVVGKAKATAFAADDYVAANRWTAVGVSAALGFLVGLLVARR